MTELAGILNLTPDSFSGDGLQGAVTSTLARIDKMVESDIAVVDIGAESTRPGAQPLTWEEEWTRLAPVVEKLGSRTERIQFSIDTRHGECARRALEKGFHWINDVSSGSDPAMQLLVKEYKCKYVLMHSMSIPADPAHTIAANVNAVDEVMRWAEQSIAKWEQAGIERSQLILDPGIGFGKTVEQSLMLIKNIATFQRTGIALLVGHSRKSFLSQFTDGKPELRDAATMAISSYLMAQNVDYLRVHDIEAHAMLKRISDML